MREDLNRASRSGTYRVLRRALRVADNELGTNETVHALASVNLEGKAAVAIATPSRLLFVSAGLFGSSTSSITLPVNGVDRSMGKMTVRTAGGARTFRAVAGARELEQAILNPDAGPVPGWRDSLPALAEAGAPKSKKKPLSERMADDLLAAGKISEEEHARRLKVFRGGK